MFAQLGLHERLLRAITELGLQQPTEVQQQFIPLAVAGRDVRATARTGSGKTAAFVLPVLHQLLQQEASSPKTSCLILAPTRELARQIQSEILAFARYTFFTCDLLVGGENFKEQAAMLRRIPEIIVATPGRLLEHIDAGNLPLVDVDVLILDEADRMLDLGFAEDILRVHQLCSRRKQTLLLSATTGGGALREITGQILHEPVHLLLNQVHELAEHVRQEIITAESAGHKEQLLRWLITNESFRKAVVFTNTRAMAERIYGRLQAEHLHVFILHGEKSQQERKQALMRFSQGSGRVLLATDVAARGLDIEGLDLVINYDMPRSGDDYVHRIGRTGRNAEAGLAVSLIEHQDWNLMSSIERYLKQKFNKRVLPGLKGSYHGPKKIKASGKAAGSKKRAKSNKDKTNNQAKRRPTSQPRINVSGDGLAPLRKSKPE